MTRLRAPVCRIRCSLLPALRLRRSRHARRLPRLRKHGHRAEAQACYQSLTQARDPYLRAEGYWGLGKYDEANNEFRAAVAQSDRNAMYRVRWGRLLHERFNNTDADALFKEALERDPKNAPGLSRLGAGQRRRLRRQGRRVGRQGARTRSEAGRSARS